jgi:hypothetical protein
MGMTYTSNADIRNKTIKPSHQTILNPSFQPKPLAHRVVAVEHAYKTIVFIKEI